MNGTIVLNPDQLAHIVEAVFHHNGVRMTGLELLDDKGGRVGFSSVVIHHVVESEGINVYPPPEPIDKQTLMDSLYPDGTKSFKSFRG